jgi:hypothetical protein
MGIERPSARDWLFLPLTGQAGRPANTAPSGRGFAGLLARELIAAQHDCVDTDDRTISRGRDSWTRCRTPTQLKLRKWLDAPAAVKEHFAGRSEPISLSAPIEEKLLVTTSRLDYATQCSRQSDMYGGGDRGPVKLPSKRRQQLACYFPVRDIIQLHCGVVACSG